MKNEIEMRTKPLSDKEVREQELRCYRFLEAKQRKICKSVNPYLSDVISNVNSRLMDYNRPININK